MRWTLNTREVIYHDIINPNTFSSLITKFSITRYKLQRDAYNGRIYVIQINHTVHMYILYEYVGKHYEIKLRIDPASS